jgi:hypothetical protein
MKEDVFFRALESEFATTIANNLLLYFLPLSLIVLTLAFPEFGKLLRIAT